ncbi:hypothetical protein [Jiangella sp. DSM 45060]|jgi:hypothetical protein|nr:hypothetical protein [Jiangella sp. DSM 45060]SDT29383.1 hypothetical protein SAMN04515669_3427 [Jiangella sp. DSM 45060]
MRDALRERSSLRIESALMRLAVFAVILAGTWFISWQLAHAISVG